MVLEVKDILIGSLLAHVNIGIYVFYTTCGYPCMCACVCVRIYTHMYMCSRSVWWRDDICMVEPCCRVYPSVLSETAWLTDVSTYNTNPQTPDRLRLDHGCGHRAGREDVLGMARSIPSSSAVQGLGFRVSGLGFRV